MDRILVLLHHQGNRRLLSEWLGHYFDVLLPDAVQSIQEPWDLLIVDGPAIEQYQKAIQSQRAAAAPTFLPCLLLTPRQPAAALKRHLGQTVDELLWTPIDKDELYTRVNILLHGRKQSLDLKRHNDELAAVLEARKAVERMKDEFIAMASHELRSPLTGMKLYLSMLLDGDAGDLTENQAHFIRVIDNSTERLAKLVNDLLDISRMTSGRLQFTFDDLELGGVIQQVLSAMQMVAQRKRIRIALDVPPAPVWVRADRDRVIQILTNLLSNAYKYSAEETAVIVRVEPREVDVQIDIIDQGMGISETDQASLFQRFFRAESVVNSHVSGTGLGLYITRLLVEAQAGQIWVDSRVNAGSTFSWTLPLAASPTAEERP